MSDLIKDEDQLTDALQAVQRLYMKLHKKKECVAFYTKHIQPIFKKGASRSVVDELGFGSFDF